MNNLKTMTGVPVEEIAAKLRMRFEGTKAYKGVPGGADLTDINTGFMIERITEVFGLRGLGWKLEYEPEHMEILGDQKRVTAHLKYAVFSYALVDEKNQAVWVPIVTSGASTNEIAYAPEGARTAAIGGAMKSLCFQLDVYKGLLDHHNAGSNGAKVEAPKPNGNGSKVETIKPNAPKTEKDLIALGKQNGLDGKGIGAALKAAGMDKVDLSRWDEMEKAIVVYAQDHAQ